MSELGDSFREMRRDSQQRRANNRANADKVLTQKCIQFEVKNDGAHFIVDGGQAGTIDFWPGTGKWIPRKTGKNNRGIRNLLIFISVNNGGSEPTPEVNIADYNEIPLPEEPNV